MNWHDDSTEEKTLHFKMLTLFRDWLWPYISQYRFLFLTSIALVLVMTSTSLAVPWLLGYIVDHVLLPKKIGFILPFSLLILGIDGLNTLASYAQTNSFNLLGQKVLHDLRQNLLKQYQFYPLSEFNQIPTGKLVTRLVNDTSNLQDLFTSGLAVAFGNISVVLGIIIWLIFLHPSLGFVSLSVFPIMLLASKFFGGLIRKTAWESRRALSRLNSFLAENISGMKIIQIFNQQKTFQERFKETSHAYTLTQIKTIESFAYFQPAITILSSLSMSLFIGYGGFLSIQKTLSLGLLVTFMSYLHSLYAPIRDITEKYNLFLSAMTSCERIFEFMNRPQEIGSERESAQAPAIEIQGKVEFKNVWFRYDENPQTPWALKNINFTILPGERIGIVGFTGAGKTTLSTLLMRYYDIQKGKILIDENDISLPKDRRSLRQTIGYIQQEPFLFSGTIEDNVFLWENERYSAFKTLPDFARAPFESGPLSLSKEIFEKGSNLSTGERQIISFMRTLVKNPRILILDEATAHMDSLTEKWIEKVSHFTFEGRTVFIIAHRLSTLKKVNRILVLHHGELVESGTHKELLAHKGIYHKLYLLQSRKEALESNSLTIQ
ncbi:MAG: ABC transporter ATP-binding protein [Chlamydiae bacterium]|nr:ABC transporter ATP-binding protein [Chlamydiota bacterium]MBI3276617.1 ABC transporter ATP-binding protein [Chlamydiota bacterium]